MKVSVVSLPTSVASRLGAIGTTLLVLVVALPCWITIDATSASAGVDAPLAAFEPLGLAFSSSITSNGGSRRITNPRTRQNGGIPFHGADAMIVQDKRGHQRRASRKLFLEEQDSNPKREFHDDQLNKLEEFLAQFTEQESKGKTLKIPPGKDSSASLNNTKKNSNNQNKLSSVGAMNNTNNLALALPEVRIDHHCDVQNVDDILTKLEKKPNSDKSYQSLFGIGFLLPHTLCGDWKLGC
ncbi:hypothetical protein ACA910_010420 [Epithemia clementina (nom. ined.)]